MTREQQILRWIREGLQRYAADLSGFRVVLFGSRARQTARERSDFDLGVIGDRPLPLKVFHEIGDYFDSLPTLYRIDWVDLNRGSRRLREEALKHAVVIHG